jgi:hypothetical protein
MRQCGRIPDFLQVRFTDAGTQGTGIETSPICVIASLWVLFLDNPALYYLVP